MTRYRKTITESYQEIQEKLKPSDGAGAYVKDFRKSDAPQFKGKSDKKIRDMAIAAYLDDKEENMKIENAFSIKERKAVITIDVRKPQVDRHVKQIMKKVGNKVKATKTAKGYVMSGDTKDLTTVVDFLFDKNLKNIINPKDMPMDIKMLKNQNETLSKKVKDELEGEQNEATMVSDISGITIANLKKEAKKKNIKVSKVSPGGPMGAEYEVTFTGAEKDLMKYAKEHLGFEGRNFRDLKKHLAMSEDMGEDMSKFYDDKALGLTKPKTYNPKTKKFEDHQVHLKTSYEKYTGVVNPFTEGRRSAYASDDEDEEGANKNIVMQLRKSLNLRGRYDVTFDDGKKVKVKEPIARAAIEKHMTFKTSRDKLAFQNKIGKSYRDLLNAIKR